MKIFTMILLAFVNIYCIVLLVTDGAKWWEVGPMSIATSVILISLLNNSMSGGGWR